MRRNRLVISLISILVLFTGCSSKIDKYITESTIIDNSSEEYESATLNPYDLLSVPTYITRIKDYYFIVDCYHDQVIYSDSLDKELTEWSVMTDDIKMGHTVASDGLVYLIDDTENNRILVFEENTDKDGNTAFINTQVFNDIGKRPHYIVYDEKTKTFYAWSSLTGEMYLFRHNENDPLMYLTEIRSIPELDGFYVRSFTIIDDKIYFVSGNLNVIEAKLNSFEIINRYPVTDEIAGMVQLTKIEDYYYITVSTDAYANQDAATLIRVKKLEDLAKGSYEDVYSNFIGGGTPYAITAIDNKYYLCEHRIPGHSIWQFDVVNNEIVNVNSLY